MALAQAIDKNALLTTVSPGHPELPAKPACSPASCLLLTGTTEEGLTCIEYDLEAANDRCSTRPAGSTPTATASATRTA